MPVRAEAAARHESLSQKEIHLYRHICGDLMILFLAVEPLYTGTAAYTNVTKKRYAAFEQWLGSLTQEPYPDGRTLSEIQNVLPKIGEIVRLYEAVQALYLRKGIDPELLAWYTWDAVDLTDKKNLLPEEKAIYVDYVNFPSLKQLEEEYGLGRANPLFEDLSDWKTDPSCVNECTKSGHRPMKLFSFESMLFSVNTVEDIITHLALAGYRPATLVEAHCFSEACSGQQLVSDIIALGSRYSHGTGLERETFLPCLYGSSDHRGIGIAGINHIHSNWSTNTRILAVRKDSHAELPLSGDL